MTLFRHLNKITAGVMNARDSWRAPPIEPELLDYIREVETGRDADPVEAPRTGETDLGVAA